MLSHKTVFVIGAGGSCAYGFPSGAQLLTQARNASVQSIRGNIRNYYDEKRVALFLEVLRESQNDSLDSLLEYRPDLEHLGQLYIASQILRSEHRVMRPSSDHLEKDWLSYLFQGMAHNCGSVSEFGKNDVTFITYNYDRLIEHRITGGLRSRYGAKEESIEGSICKFWEDHPVVHLHGCTGLLSKGIIKFGAIERPGQSIDDAVANVLERAAAGIKIVHQADGKDAEFERAREALGRAERVVFLGFGFGWTNVDRLEIGCISSIAETFASRSGLTDSEVAVQILEPFKKSGRSVTLAGRDDDCRLTLRHRLDRLVNRYE